MKTRIYAAPAVKELITMFPAVRVAVIMGGDGKSPPPNCVSHNNDN